MSATYNLSWADLTTELTNANSNVAANALKDLLQNQFKTTQTSTYDGTAFLTGGSYVTTPITNGYIDLTQTTSTTGNAFISEAPSGSSVFVKTDGGNVLVEGTATSNVTLVDMNISLNSDDTIYGAAKGEIVSQGGNNWLVAGAGKETLIGGSGHDTLDASNSTKGDWLVGGSGSDTLYGGSGADTLFGGGHSMMYAGSGNDTLFGGRFANSADTLNGGAGQDTLSVQYGDNSLVGGTGLNELYGGAGSDTLVGGGDSNLFAGSGNYQTLLGSSNGGHDTLSAGTGTGDYLQVFSGNNWLVGGAGTAMMIAGKGNDTLFGGGGSDTMNTGTGNDTLFGGSGFDTMNLGTGTNYVVGRSGHDTVNIGTTGNATIFGGNSTEVYSAQSENSIKTDEVVGGVTYITFKGGQTLDLNNATLNLHGGGTIVT